MDKFKTYSEQINSDSDEELKPTQQCEPFSTPPSSQIDGILNIIVTIILQYVIVSDVIDTLGLSQVLKIVLSESTVIFSVRISLNHLSLCI